MGRRGPVPTPTELKKLRGNPGKRQLPKDEPKPDAAPSIEPPAFLDADGRKVWIALAPEQHRLGLLTVVETGSTSFAMLCNEIAGYWREERRYRRAKDADKDRIARRRKRHLEGVVQLGQRFGFTPGDRVRLIAPTPQDPGAGKGKEAPRGGQREVLDPHDELARRRAARAHRAPGSTTA